MNRLKRATMVSTAAAALVVASLATAPSASAASYHGCTYPHVCFYLTDSDWDSNHPTAAYQDVTSYYQTLGSSSRGANEVYNSRNDDRVYLRYDISGVSGTHYVCVPPHNQIYFSPALTVTGIRIDTASSC